MMKKAYLLLTIALAYTSAHAQQKPDFERSRAPQILSDRALKARDILVIPHGATETLPAYVPDSSKTARLFFNTGALELFVGGNKVADTVKAMPYRFKGAANGVATLDGAGKVPLAQLPANLLVYKGQWNPSTNTPSLVNGTGTTGDVWEASADGDHNFGSGTLHFLQGDFVIYNGSAWQLSAGTNRVTSVNGYQGIVNLNTDDVGEGSTNKYYTQARVQAWADLAYAPISGSGNYLNLTGSPQTITQNANITGALTFNNSITFDNLGGSLRNIYFKNADGTYSTFTVNPSTKGIEYSNTISAPTLIATSYATISGGFEVHTDMTMLGASSTSQRKIAFTNPVGLFSVLLTASNVTGSSNYVQTLQAKTGTIADLSDIPSSGTYIQNQNTAAQTGSDFWIDGTAQADTFIASNLTGVDNNLSINSQNINIASEETDLSGTTLNFNYANLSLIGASVTVNGGTFAFDSSVEVTVGKAPVNPTDVLRLTDLSGLSGTYQPLENQRLSTTNTPTFAGVTVSNSIVGASLQGAYQSNAGTITSSNLAIPSGSGGSGSTLTPLQFGGVSGTVVTRVYMRGSTSALPASGQNYGGLIVGAQDVTASAASTYNWFATAVFKPLTITASGGTVSNTATVYSEGAASGGANNYSFYSASGLNAFLNPGEQLRLLYDASHYTSLTTNSSGNFVVSPTGLNTTINGRLFVTQAASGFATGNITIKGSAADGNGLNITFNNSTTEGSFSNPYASGIFTFYVNSAEKARIDNSGNFGVGTSLGNAKIQALSTTEQLRLNYDASNYASFTVNSSGNLTIGTTGSIGNTVTIGNLLATTNLTVSNNTANFSVPLTTGAFSSGNAISQFASSANNYYRTQFYGSTSTTLSSNSNYSSVLFTSAPVTTFTSGTHAWISNIVVKPVGTITSGGAAVTNTASLFIDGVASGGTSNYALYVSGSGNSRFEGSITANNLFTQFLTSANGSTYGQISFPTSGILLTRNIADGNIALIVNQANSASTGLIQQWQFNSSSVASIDKTGVFYGTGLSNSITNNAYIQTLSTGIKASRNIADANIAFIVNQANASSTGFIQQWQFSGTEVAHIETDGTFVSNKNIHGSGNGEFSSYVLASQFKISSLNTAPANSSDTGTAGEIRYTSTGIFWCIATNSWIKVTGSTF